MDLLVRKREKFGKGAKGLRREGLVPAELYGRGIENLHLSVPIKDLRRVLKEAGENTLVNVVLEKESRPALIYDVQSDALSDDILQVDLYQVKMDEKIETKVPLEFIGESPATKSGGVLVKSMQEVDVEALPADLPRKIEVDISGIKEIGQSLYVSSLKTDQGVKIKALPETVVATVVEKVTEEQEAAEAAATPSVEAVSVETEEKKVERQAKKEASGGAAAEKEQQTPPPASKKQ